MAQTLYSDEERCKRIEMVGNYILETGDSYREAASFFTENFFPITAATVCDYCKRFQTMFPVAGKTLREVINSHKDTVADNEDVRIRVLNNTRLYLNGKTVDDISEITGTPYFVVYRDLTKRLPMLDLELFGMVRERMDLLKHMSDDEKKARR